MECVQAQVRQQMKPGRAALDLASTAKRIPPCGRLVSLSTRRRPNSLGLCGWPTASSTASDGGLGGWEGADIGKESVT
jgi:hypothetical protein